MANRIHKGFLTIDSALNMDKSDIRNFPMKHHHGAATMFVNGEDITL